MAFPQTALPIKVELQLNSAWTDITTDVRGEQQIRITRGRSDESGQTDTTRCLFTLDNNAGNYSPRNPVGAYYGQIGRNTPCRVSVMTGASYLDMTGTNVLDFAQTVDTAALDITGDLDVRLDVTLANWLPPTASGETVEMIGKFAGSGQKSWFLGTRSGRLYFEWSPDGTTSLSASSTIPPVVPGAGGRLAIRVTLDVNNGSSGNTVTFYTAATLDSPWTQLGDPVVQAGVTSIFNSTSNLRIGNATGFAFNLPLGRCHSAEVRNGLWGTVVAQPYFSQQAAGTTSFVDSAGRTWTTSGTTQITNRQTRFVGEISAWPVRWETKKDVVVNVEASGVMRRLGQGASPVRSAMFREFTNPARTGIVAYWPMEDDASATNFASAFDGQLPMRLPGAGGVTPAAFSEWTSSAPLPTYSFGTTTVKLPGYTGTGIIFTRLFVTVPAGGVSGTDRLFSFTTNGSARTWSLFVNTSGALDLRAYDEDGTQLFATGFSAFNINGLQRLIGVELTQNGSNIDYKLIVFQLENGTYASTLSTQVTGTLNSNTIGYATEARIGQSGLLNGTAVGHMTFASASAFANTTGAMAAYAGEATTARLYRLGKEENIPTYAASLSEELMGAQGLSTLLDLMREAETADEGILVEGRNFFGFRFRDHVSLYNQKPALTLDYTGSSGLVTPLEPTDDDQNVRNDRTVQRTNGSSTRKTLDTGALSTQAPPNGVGRYADSVTENLFTDGQTANHAGWVLRLGTWDETRYPVVHMVLSKAPALLEAAASVDVGDRIQITNPPSWLPPDTIDLMVQGYTETLDQFTWNLDWNCTPAGPWDVMWLGSASSAAATREFPALDTSGSTLAEDLTQTETDVDVLTTPGNALWTPNVADTPFDLRIGGEVMTVTAPGTLQVTNPFFDTDLTAWSGASATVDWSTAYVHPHPRAKASMRVTPAGGVAAVSGRSDLTAVGSIIPGQQYKISAWVFSTNGWNGLYPSAQWADSGGTILSSSGISRNVSASVWTYLEDTVTAPASASRLRMTVRADNTPTTSDTYYVWGARITRVTSSWLHDTFSRTSSSSWGQADSGQTWQTGGGTAGDYNVASKYGAHRLATTDASRRCFVDCTYTDFDYYASLTTSATATGGSLYGGPTGRYIDSDNLYQARLEFTTGNVLILSIRKRVAGVETQLGTSTLTWTHAAGTYIRVRFQAAGTTLRAKAWRAGDVEPGVWHVTATDSSITTSSFIGLRSISSPACTNVNPEVRYDQAEVINPQTYTVVRSANRAVKTQSAGTAAVLAYPPAIAL